MRGSSPRMTRELCSLRPRLCSAPLRKGHSASKTRVHALMALRCVRGTASYPALDSWLGAGIATIGGLALRPSTWKPATRL
jgi:hypothetical protein